jgi:hypothetical protein
VMKCTCIPLPQSISAVLLTTNYLNQQVAALVGILLKSLCHNICIYFNFVTMHLSKFFQYWHLYPFTSHSLNYTNSNEFWGWCITLGINEFLKSVHCSVLRKNTTFRKLELCPSSVEITKRH